MARSKWFGLEYALIGIGVLGVFFAGNISATGAVVGTSIVPLVSSLAFALMVFVGIALLFFESK